MNLNNFSKKEEKGITSRITSRAATSHITGIKGRFPLTLPHRRHHWQPLTLMVQLATSQCFNNYDCSLKLILKYLEILSEIKDILNHNAVQCTCCRTNQS